MKSVINKGQIKYDTGRASLISLPNSNKKRFWLPNSLIYKNGSGNTLTIILPERMDFTLLYGKKSSKKVEYNYIAKFLENVDAPGVFLEPVYERHTPEKVDAKEPQIDASLIR